MLESDGQFHASSFRSVAGELSSGINREVEDAPNVAPDYEFGGQEFESLRARQ